MTSTPTESGASGPRPATAGREGSLEAPTRHPLDWQNPAFYDEAALTKELERVFDICHGCRRCFSLCNSFPTLFDAIDASATGELDGGGQEGLLAGGGPLLSLRHVLHDEVSVRAAASLERRLPAPDAARQGRAHPQGGRQLARPRAGRDRHGRQDRRHPRRRARSSTPSTARAPAARCWRRRSASTRRAPIPEYHSRTARKRLRRLAAADGRAAVADAGDHAARWRSSPPATATATSPDRRGLVAVFEHNDIPVTLVAAGALLRHAASSSSATSRRSRELQGGQHPAADGADRRGLRHRRADPLLRADVQAGAAADVSRTTRTCSRCAKRIYDPFEYLMLRHKSRASCRPTSSARSARSATTCPATCACRTSG